MRWLPKPNGPAGQRRLRFYAIGVLCAAVMGAWWGSGGLIPSESAATSEPRERWVFTTKAHLSGYALLTGAPIFRDQIRSVLLDPARVYIAVAPSRSGVLFPPGGGVQFLAMDRHRGHRVWEMRVPVDGYPVGNRMVQVMGTLVAALYEEQTKELVILGMNATNGTVVWRVSLPGYEHLSVYGEILEADPKGASVSIYLPETKQRNRIVLRATDGQRLTETSFNGYFWSAGARQARRFIFGYEGDPRTHQHHRLLVFHENTGQLAWTLPLFRQWVSPPVAVDDSLLFSNNDELTLIDLSTGKSRWTAKLGGRVPPNPDPPVVVGPKVGVAHHTTSDPEDKRWTLSIRRLGDGGPEAEASLDVGEWDTPSVLRQMGELVIVGTTLGLQVIDARDAGIRARLDFKKLFSLFVYATPSIRLADSDERGFVVVTPDGRMRYYSVEDFRSLGAAARP